MGFPRRNLPLPRRPFPFDPPVQMLPKMNTRLPLSPYCNPLPVQLRQPRCFPLQNVPILSLFCKHGFQRRSQLLSGHNSKLHIPLSPHVHSRQATLHAARDSAHRLAGSFLVRTRAGPVRDSYRRRTISGLHGNWVVCPMPLGRALNP